MARGVSHRDVTKEQFWRGQIAGQPGSGLSILGYCRRHRLHEWAFYFWRKELARRGLSTAAATFVPVRVTADEALGRGQVVGPLPGRPEPEAVRQATEESQPPGRIEVVLGNGCRVHVVGAVDWQALADVLAVLEGRPC